MPCIVLRIAKRGPASRCPTLLRGPAFRSLASPVANQLIRQGDDVLLPPQDRVGCVPLAYLTRCEPRWYSVYGPAGTGRPKEDGFQSPVATPAVGPSELARWLRIVRSKMYGRKHLAISLSRVRKNVSPAIAFVIQRPDVILWKGSYSDHAWHNNPWHNGSNEVVAAAPESAP